MKPKINYYTLQLLKQNSLYIVSLTIFFILLAVVVPIQIKHYFSYRDKIQQLNKEITDLKRKKTIIYSFSPEEADVLIRTLNNLLPSEEDYFSVSTALQRLSNITDFKIISYSINFKGKAGDKLSLTVEGEGTPNAILSFLRSYQSRGGRLITMDEISFSPATSKTTLTLNFYAKDVKIKTTRTTPKIDKKLVDLVKKISEDLSADNQPVGRDEAQTVYSVTDNPFQF